MEFLSPEGLRLDGRRPKELRRLHCEVGTLGEADGSATFDMGNTKARANAASVQQVVAAVFGPHAAPGQRAGGAEPARVHCELGIAAFSAGERRKRTQRDRRIQEIGAMLTAAMRATILVERLPGTVISIYVQVLAADGSLQAAALNAASLAAADAGIPMHDLVAGCMAARMEGEGVLDLNHTEEAIGSSCHLFMAAHCNLDLVVVLQSEGRMKPDELEALAELAAAGCKAAGSLIRASLLDNTKQLALARGPVAF